MITKAIIPLALLLACSICFAGTTGGASDDRETMPSFELRSGNRETLTQDAIAGRIVLFFYESESAMSVNQGLKDRLEREFGRTGNAGAPSGADYPFVLPVADCSRATWPLIPFWERALRDYTKKIGYTLWGDWTGRLREECGLAENEANFLVLDRDGRVRYRARGSVGDREIDDVVSLVDRLLKDAR